MKLRVQLFAVAKQRLGQSEIEVELPAAATIAQLRTALAEQHPALAALLPNVRIALDETYAADTAVVPPTAQLAIIPPVSGG